MCVCTVRKRVTIVKLSSFKIVYYSEVEAKQHLNSFPIIPPHVFKRMAVSQW